MKKKILFFDTETTGLDPRKAAPIQVAFLIDIDGHVVEEGNLLIQPHAGAEISKQALAINKRTEEEIVKPPFLPTREGYRKITDMFTRHVDKFNRADKFYPAGYNVGFDVDFLGQFFERNGDKYFGSWMNGRRLDPREMMAWLDYSCGLQLKDHKLSTVCEYFGITIQAHDALSDIRATRDLFRVLHREKHFREMLNSVEALKVKKEAPAPTTDQDVDTMAGF